MAKGGGVAMMKRIMFWIVVLMVAIGGAGSLFVLAYAAKDFWR